MTTITLNTEKLHHTSHTPRVLSATLLQNVRNNSPALLPPSPSVLQDIYGMAHQSLSSTILQHSTGMRFIFFMPQSVACSSSLLSSIYYRDANLVHQLRNWWTWAEERAQWLRSLVAVPGHPGSIHSTYMMPLNYLSYLSIQFLGF